MNWKKTTTGIVLAGTLGTGGLFAADRAIDPYTDRGEVLEIARESVVEDAGEVKIELVKARPEVRFKKWNGEVDLGVRYNNVQASGSRAPLTDRMEWKGQGEEVHAYPLEAGPGMEDGGFEIEVVLDAVPASNVFTFAIDGAEGLDFFYQPPLTAEEIAEGASRPENVEGSYAVYHKENKNHRVGSINYAAGKAFHIYRPKAFDANGGEVWAELSYDERVGELSVTVPAEWLNEAVYPVRVDPTFGHTSQGASAQAIGGDLGGGDFEIYLIANDDYTPVEDGTLDSVTASIGADAGTTFSAKALVYQEDSAGADVHDVIAVDENTGIPVATDWRTFTMSGESVSASNNYLLLINADPETLGTAGNFYISYDDGIETEFFVYDHYYAEFGDEAYTHAVYTSPADPLTMDSYDHGGEIFLSIYATYTTEEEAVATTSDLHFNNSTMQINNGRLRVK